MSDQDQNDRPEEFTKDIVFRNPDTLLRRAWIERALAGVRRRLDPEATEARITAGSKADAQSGAVPVEKPSVPPARGAPKLYVVDGGRRR